MNAMTDKQLQFIAWLITTATDKCKDMDEVRKMNEEIRRHSAGLKDEADSDNEKKGAALPPPLLFLGREIFWMSLEKRIPARQ